MKKIALSLATMASLTLMSASSFAASTGTITFNGELTDTTCNVDVNGQGSDATVTLPTVSVKELLEEKQTAGLTSFNINLSECAIGTENGKSRVSAFFQPGTTVDLSSGRLKNMGGDATNVQLQLLDATGDFKVINVGNTAQVSNMAYVPISEDGKATLPYAVEYYAVDKTTPGTVTSSVVYNLQYQ